MVRSKKVIFHKHETIANIHRSRKTSQYPTVVADVKPISLSSGGATDREAILKMKPGNVIELVANVIPDGGLNQGEQSPEVAIDSQVRRSLRDH